MASHTPPFVRFRFCFVFLHKNLSLSRDTKRRWSLGGARIDRRGRAERVSVLVSVLLLLLLLVRGEEEEEEEGGGEERTVAMATVAPQVSLL